MAHLSLRLIALVLLAFRPLAADAQVRPPRVSLAPVVEATGVPPGGTVRLALQVTLPEGFHVQSNAPRDPLLIPTELTVDAPRGVTVTQIVFPAATELTQVGQTESLAVFEHVFVIGVRLDVAPGTAPGAVVAPARLRYQACNEQLCFPPATVTTRWTVPVVAAGTPISLGHRELFSTLRFETGAGGQKKR